SGGRGDRERTRAWRHQTRCPSIGAGDGGKDGANNHDDKNVFHQPSPLRLLPLEGLERTNRGTQKGPAKPHSAGARMILARSISNWAAVMLLPLSRRRWRRSI